MVNDILDAKKQQIWLPSGDMLFDSQKEDWTNFVQEKQLSVLVGKPHGSLKRLNIKLKSKRYRGTIVSETSRNGPAHEIRCTLISTRGNQEIRLQSNPEPFSYTELAWTFIRFPTAVLCIPAVGIRRHILREFLTRIMKHNCTSVPITEQRIHVTQKYQDIYQEISALLRYLDSRVVDSLVVSR